MRRLRINVRREPGRGRNGRSRWIAAHEDASGFVRWGLREAQSRSSDYH